MDGSRILTVNLPGQQVAKAAAHQLPEPSELSRQEVSTILMGHPVTRRGREKVLCSVITFHCKPRSQTRSGGSSFCSLNE